MSADEYDGPNPQDLPDDHPLAGFEEVLDDHEAHINALAEYLDETRAEEIRSLMLIVTTDESSDTIPTIRDDAEFDRMVWFQLAAHISHVAHAFDSPPEAVARHACHVLRERGEESPAPNGGDEA